MPNWVFNTLTIEGPEETITRLRKILAEPSKFQTEKQEPIFSFNNIIPIDDKDETISAHDVWGTKWDACFVEALEVENEKTNLAYKFETAWSVAQPAFEELAAQNPDVEIVLDFEEETGWFGDAVWKNGVEFQSRVIEPACHQDYVDGDRVCQCENDEAVYEDCPNYEDPED